MWHAGKSSFQGMLSRLVKAKSSLFSCESSSFTWKTIEKKLLNVNQIETLSTKTKPRILKNQNTLNQHFPSQMLNFGIGNTISVL